MTEGGSFRTVLLGIVRYIVEHPDAKDTIDGIVAWWRPPAAAGWSPRDVRAALDFLSARSWVTVRAVGEDVRLYGASTGRLKEIIAFLADLERREPEE